MINDVYTKEKEV